MKVFKAVLFSFLSLLVISSSLVSLSVFSHFISATEFLTEREVLLSPEIDGDFTVKGFCRVPDGYLISGNKDSSEAGIYMIRDDGKTTYTALLDEYFDVFYGSANGIFFFDEFIYLASGSAVYVYYYEDFYVGLEEAEYYEVFETYGSADWCTVYDGLLYVGENKKSPSADGGASGEGEAYDKSRSLITVFRVGENIRYGIYPVPLCIIYAPYEIQGMAIGHSGVILSVGEENRANLEFHSFDRYSYDYTDILHNGEDINILTYFIGESTLKSRIPTSITVNGLHYSDGVLYGMSGGSESYLKENILGERIWKLPLKKEYFK